nr:c-type cytochrome [Gammaproteobacteria bacterium]NIT53387.1 c-type cytochrome [candidate division Zixibacteria bacterium]NIW41663.1 c-type cytochrome [candidate division Zixibacteria bacterium]NIX56747.1 c-type cytochrome [candidate division Zixibacteria bacterium]
MFSHRRLLLIALPLVLGVFFIITSVNLTAQQEEWTPENLQVLSEDMSRDQVGAIMSQFTDALGVGCGHCHASTPESGGRLDFASDLNANKDVAREMMHMTQTINMDLLPATGRDNLLSVQCMTCHNGLARPTTLQQEIMAAYDAGGPDSAVTRYQELRQQYYGRTAFDFGEQALL